MKESVIDHNCERVITGVYVIRLTWVFMGFAEEPNQGGSPALPICPEEVPPRRSG